MQIKDFLYMEIQGHTVHVWNIWISSKYALYGYFKIKIFKIFQKLGPSCLLIYAPIHPYTYLLRYILKTPSLDTLTVL